MWFYAARIKYDNTAFSSYHHIAITVVLILFCANDRKYIANTKVWQSI